MAEYLVRDGEVFLAATRAAVLARMSYGYFMRLSSKGKGPEGAITNDGKKFWPYVEIKRWHASASWRTCVRGQNVKRKPRGKKVCFELYVDEEWLRRMKQKYSPLSPIFRKVLEAHL